MRNCKRFLQYTSLVWKRVAVYFGVTLHNSYDSIIVERVGYNFIHQYPPILAFDDVIGINRKAAFTYNLLAAE